jgi:hypothetical protein
MSSACNPSSYEYFVKRVAVSHKRSLITGGLRSRTIEKITRKLEISLIA